MSFSMVCNQISPDVFDGIHPVRNYDWLAGCSYAMQKGSCVGKCAQIDECLRLQLAACTHECIRRSASLMAVH